MDEFDGHGVGGPAISAESRVVFPVHSYVTGVAAAIYSRTTNLRYNEYARDLHDLYRVTTSESMANILQRLST